MPDLKAALEAAIKASLSSDESARLGLAFGPLKITAPGQHVPKADAASAPELSFAGATDTGTYMVLGIDLDAPFPSFSLLGPVLHSSDDVPPIADYAGPGPPPGSGPHRYLFLLYEQPEGFERLKFAPEGGKTMGIRPRMRFDLAAFERAAGLGEMVGCNYFVSS